MTVFAMSLPLPDRALSPNRKNGRHWSVTSDIVATARHDAKITVLERLSGKPSPFANDKKSHYRLHIYFVLPDNKRRDLDNLKASLKPSIDGMCDALEIDDNQIVSDTQEKIVDPSSNQVLILIEQIPKQAITFKSLSADLNERFKSRIISSSMFHVKH